VVIISVLTVIAVLAGADVCSDGPGRAGRRDALVLGAAVLLILIVARPGRYRPRTGADRDDAFDGRVTS